MEDKVANSNNLLYRILVYKTKASTLKKKLIIIDDSTYLQVTTFCFYDGLGFSIRMSFYCFNI